MGQSNQDTLRDIDEFIQTAERLCDPYFVSNFESTHQEVMSLRNGPSVPEMVSKSRCKAFDNYYFLRLGYIEEMRRLKVVIINAFSDDDESIELFDGFTNNLKDDGMPSDSSEMWPTIQVKLNTLKRRLTKAGEPSPKPNGSPPEEDGNDGEDDPHAPYRPPKWFRDRCKLITTYNLYSNSRPERGSIKRITEKRGKSCRHCYSVPDVVRKWPQFKSRLRIDE